MKTYMKIILGLIVSVILIFLFRFIGLVQYKFFAPQYQEARREVREHSASYVEGVRQEVSKLQYEYVTTEDPKKKVALKNMIIQRTANIDKSLLSKGLRDFLESLKE